MHTGIHPGSGRYPSPHAFSVADQPRQQRADELGSVARWTPRMWCDGLSGPSGHREPVRLFVFARHAESSANIAGVVSANPARLVGLTARGRAQARQLGSQLAALDIDLGVCTRFLRTRQTLEIALRDRVPVVTDPGFDEIRAGDFEGEPIQKYWSWNEHHPGSERFPHGESVNEALLRYANALRRLLSRPAGVALLVVHEFALRHIAAAATSALPMSPSPPFANAVPYLFGERAIERAAAGLEASVRSDRVGRSSERVSPRGPGRRRI